MSPTEWDLERELLEALPEEEREANELEELYEQIRGEAREFLGLRKDAPLEEIQAAFGGWMWGFWQFFFPHYRRDGEGHEIPPAKFHQEFVEALQELVLQGRPGEQLERACPREHAKSVFASLLWHLWALVNELRWFGVILSDTDRQAWEFLDDIRVEVETNERLQAIYPEACEWERPPRSNRLAFGNGRTLMAAGSGKSLRGMRKGAHRPDMISLDDIENDEEVQNPRRRERKMRWYHRVVKKLGVAAVIAIVGTILHADSFLAAQIKDDSQVYAALVQEPERMDLWDEWEKLFHDRSLEDSERAAFEFWLEHQREMQRGAEVLWPARVGLYQLMVERAEDLASFLSERQNDPFDPKASWFPEERITWSEPDELPPLTDVVLSVGFWDPSRGTVSSDTSCIVRLDCYQDGRRIVTQDSTERIPPEEVMDIGIGWHKLRRFDVWGVEKVGLSNYDGDLAGRFESLHLRTVVVPYTPVGAKPIRIKSLRPMIVSGQLGFATSLSREAKKQLGYYPSHPNDDFPDAVHAANQLADEYLQDVVPAGAGRDTTDDELEVGRKDVFGRDLREEEPPGLMRRLGERIGLVGSIRA